MAAQLIYQTSSSYTGETALPVQFLNNNTYMMWVSNVYLHVFSLFLQFNQTGHGSLCSQAIMLVTDGATEMYDDVFEKYNWPERKVILSLCFSPLSLLFITVSNFQCHLSFFWLFCLLCTFIPVGIDVHFNTLCQLELQSLTFWGIDLLLHYHS